MGIVEMSFILIVEDLVGFADRFELDLGSCSFAFADFVRMT